MHGPTFMGNPLACAVSLAALDLVESDYWRPRVARIETLLQDVLTPLAQYDSVADARVLGAIGVVEMAEPVDMSVATRTVLDQGVWLRPFGRLLYTMPPFTCSDSEIGQIIQAMEVLA